MGGKLGWCYIGFLTVFYLATPSVAVWSISGVIQTR